MKIITCSTCAHFEIRRGQKGDTTWGLCKRYPPRNVAVGSAPNFADAQKIPGTLGEVLFTLVPETEWCGEYSSRP